MYPSAPPGPAPPPGYQPPIQGYPPPPQGYPPPPEGYQPTPKDYQPPPQEYPPPPQPGYQPPPQGYQPQPPPQYVQPQQATVVVVAPMPIFGRISQPITCQYCQAAVTTSTQTKSGWLPWAICAGLAFLGLFLFLPFFCCWVPFVVGSCKDVQHSCPNCNRVVGECKVIKR